ncbi:MAG: hypothetical protein ACREPK_03230, partial [Rhodanobacteraceae bacterium]
RPRITAVAVVGHEWLTVPQYKQSISVRCLGAGYDGGKSGSRRLRCRRSESTGAPAAYKG